MGIRGMNQRQVFRVLCHLCLLWRKIFHLEIAASPNLYLGMQLKLEKLFGKTHGAIVVGTRMYGKWGGSDTEL